MAAKIHVRLNTKKDKHSYIKVISDTAEFTKNTTVKVDKPVDQFTAENLYKGHDSVKAITVKLKSLKDKRDIRPDETGDLTVTLTTGSSTTTATTPVAFENADE